MPELSRVLLLAACLLVGAGDALAGRTNSLMDVSPDGARLLVANSDNGTVSVVDTQGRKVLHEVKVGDKPEGVTWIGKGPLAAVTVYREDAVVIFNADDGKIVKRMTVPDEPYGIVASKDGARAWVTHEYPGIVSEIDLQKYTIVREMKAGAFVRGIGLSSDEKRLYVSEFYTAQLLAIDLAGGKVVDTWKGQSADNLARQVELHPTRPKAYLSHIRSKIEVAQGNGSIFPQLTIYTLTPDNGSARRTSIATDTYNGVYVITNPWEAAVSPDGKRIYTIYAATDDMNVSAVMDDDYKEMERIGGAVRVGKQPRAVRVSPDSKTVYVYNSLDFTVSVHDANLRSQGAAIKVCEPAKTPEWVRGKYLFGTANFPMTGRRWIACSSCHPDGQTDGRVWQNPEGKRKTPAMMGMAHTHPLHWSADRDEVQDFEYTIRGKLMGGGGLIRGQMRPKDGFKPTELDETTSNRSTDLDALAIYCNSFDFQLSPHAAGGKLSAASERGKALFFSEKVGCATCHSGPYYSDSTLQKPYKVHDVGTGGEDETEKIGPKYDTPTLLGVYRTPPYLHHGKAKTLQEVLTTYNKGDKHGKTSQLKPAEIDDLVEFLKALPYEQPPAKTENTVKYRVEPKKE